MQARRLIAQEGLFAEMKAFLRKINQNLAILSRFMGQRIGESVSGLAF
jgi:hypothetical protein